MPSYSTLSPLTIHQQHIIMATSDNFTVFECVALELGALEQRLDAVEFQNTNIIVKGA